MDIVGGNNDPFPRAAGHNGPRPRDLHERLGRDASRRQGQVVQGEGLRAVDDVRGRRGRPAGSDPDAGLTAAQVTAARCVHGYNELDKEEGKPLWKLVLEQFDDALVKILLLAAVISFVIAFTEERAPGVEISIVDFVEPGVILLILILNAVVGVWQESNAESALEALKEMQSETAQCLRDGGGATTSPRASSSPAAIVEVRTEDRVPADCRVADQKTATVLVDRASLTGESVSVGDRTRCRMPGANFRRRVRALRRHGRDPGRVRGVRHRRRHEGRLVRFSRRIQEASEETEDTPLKQKLDDFGDQPTWFIGVICLLVWLMNYHFFIDWRWSAEDPFVVSDVAFNFSACSTTSRSPSRSPSPPSPRVSPR